MRIAGSLLLFILVSGGLCVNAEEQSRDPAPQTAREKNKPTPEYDVVVKKIILSGIKGSGVWPKFLVVVANAGSREIDVPFKFSASLGDWNNVFQIKPDSTFTNLAPGKEVTYDISYAPISAGDNKLVICLDTEGAIAGEDTANNRFEYIFTFDPGINGPIADIMIRDLSLDPDSSIEGARIGLTAVIENRGGAIPELSTTNLNANFIRTTLEYRRQAGSEWQSLFASNYDLRKIYPFQNTSIALEPNRHLEAGSYEFRIIADQWASLKDTDRSNNMMIKKFDIQLSPLEITDFSPLRQGWGGSVKIDFKTSHNMGLPKDGETPKIIFYDIPAETKDFRALGNGTYEITATVPEGAKTGFITISGYGVTSKSAYDITIFGPPSISRMAPGAACIGSEITISGDNFVKPMRDGEGTIVIFTRRDQTREATPFSIDYNQMKLVVPQDVSSGPICVRTVIGGKMFSSEKDFYFTVTPKIIAVYPDKAGAGEQVIINGSGFGPTPSIKFGGAEAKIIYSNNVKVAVEVPRGEGECIINFTNTDGQSCEWPFTINKQ